MSEKEEFAEVSHPFSTKEAELDNIFQVQTTTKFSLWIYEEMDKSTFHSTLALWPEELYKVSWQVCNHSCEIIN